ncbi:hypothetical protein FEK30_00600 (plasmid) [Picosynechococcus sp. PCC 11901]|uniref:hypothetical protein n=1 Tax=Picosynechococcus sp. PCC 11901 TaxID=2579791 RepID=UPI0010FC0F32|nr:hypothetical protein [Picosynechococcus sp. PCC 11901]QCS48059.1 hypothetical protein FEK30_00600 [Picosynechococcus sp. PCC 11901]
MDTHEHKQLADILSGYFEALDFCTIDNPDFWEDTDISQEDYQGYDSAMKFEATTLCEKFYKDNHPHLKTLDIEQLRRIGNDLYFTIQGHGVGFWEKDRGYPHGDIFDAWVTTHFPKGRDTEYLSDDGHLCSTAGDAIEYL